MKPIAITADIHLGEHAGSATIVDGMNSRLVDCQNAFRETVDAAVAAGCRTLIVAGDWFHDRKRITVPTLDASATCINYAESKSIQTVCLVGNHDMSLNGSFMSIRRCGFSQVIVKPCVKEIDGYQIGFIPWTEDDAEVKDALHQFGSIDFVVGHLGVSGGLSGPSSIEIPGHIDCKTLRRNVPVFLGHYHKPHTVKDTNVHYIGSPLQLNWGEAGEDKSFVLWKGTQWKRVPLTRSPRHVRVTGDKVENVRTCDFVKVTGSTAAAVAEKIKAASVMVEQVVSDSVKPVNGLSGLPLRKQAVKYMKTNPPDDREVALAVLKELL